MAKQLFHQGPADYAVYQLHLRIKSLRNEIHFNCRRLRCGHRLIRADPCTRCAHYPVSDFQAINKKRTERKRARKSVCPLFPVDGGSALLFYCRHHRNTKEGKGEGVEVISGNGFRWLLPPSFLVGCLWPGQPSPPSSTAVWWCVLVLFDPPRLEAADKKCRIAPC